MADCFWLKVTIVSFDNFLIRNHHINRDNHFLFVIFEPKKIGFSDLLVINKNRLRSSWCFAILSLSKQALLKRKISWARFGF